jgi:hypothetical protein
LYYFVSDISKLIKVSREGQEKCKQPDTAAVTVFMEKVNILCNLVFMIWYEEGWTVFALSVICPHSREILYISVSPLGINRDIYRGPKLNPFKNTNQNQVSQPFC